METNFREKLETMLGTSNMNIHEQKIFMDGYQAGFKEARDMILPTIDIDIQDNCVCRKCGDEVYCLHNKSEPHERSMCGSCAM